MLGMGAVNIAETFKARSRNRNCCTDAVHQTYQRAHQPRTLRSLVRFGVDVRGSMLEPRGKLAGTCTLLDLRNENGMWTYRTVLRCYLSVVHKY
eukprot:5118860-Amphidinium_carterae.1